MINDKSRIEFNFGVFRISVKSFKKQNKIYGIIPASKVLKACSHAFSPTVEPGLNNL